MQKQSNFLQTDFNFYVEMPYIASFLQLSLLTMPSSGVLAPSQVAPRRNTVYVKLFVVSYVGWSLKKAGLHTWRAALLAAASFAKDSTPVHRKFWTIYISKINCRPIYPIDSSTTSIC